MTFQSQAFIIPLHVARHSPALDCNSAVRTIIQTHPLSLLVSSSSSSALSGSLIASAAASSASAAIPISGGSSFVQLLLVFLLGGLLGSALFASLSASMNVGQRNMGRGVNIVSYLFRKTWRVFTSGLRETRIALRRDGRWHWKLAWDTLRLESFSATRLAAAEGVSAIRKQADMYSAAVGKPGLLLAQYVVNHLLAFNLATTMEKTVQEALSQVRNSNIRTLKLGSFDMGEVPPELSAARIYNLGEDSMAFDVDMRWKSKVVAKITLITRRIGLRVPVEINNFSFDGTVRVQLTPLIMENPGYGAMLVSLVTIPKMNLSVKVGGAQITRVPWLKQEILTAARDVIRDELLWPRRSVVPATRGPNGPPFLSPAQLAALHTQDPLLIAEDGLREMPLLRDRLRDLAPREEDLDKELQVDMIDENNDGIPDKYQTW